MKNSFRRFGAFVSGKYLFSRGEKNFTSFLVVTAMLGVAVGVSALIIVLSVMTGFSNELEKKLRGFNPHITVLAPTEPSDELINEIKSSSNAVDEVSRYATGEVIVQVEGDHGLSALGSKVFGYERLPSRITKGATFFWGDRKPRVKWLEHLVSPFNEGAILGVEMLYQLGAFPDYNNDIQLIAPFGGLDPFGNPAPKRRAYLVVGGFRSGFFEYDVKYTILPYDETKRLLGDQARFGLQIMLDDSKKVPVAVSEIKKIISDDSSIYGWSDKNKKLFAALKLERIAMAFMLFLIIIIASFSVVGVVLMLFFSKRKDLAVLMSMGASRKKVKNVFVWMGAIIGGAGSIIGVLVSLVVCFLIKKGNIALPPTYYLDHLPVEINPLTIMIVAIGGVLISIIASYYPAKRAAMIDPVALLRGE